MRTELTPMYDTRKSFYNKAVIEAVGNELNLYSYNTLVARIVKSANIVEVYNLQSTTTLRHVKEFLLQNNFRADNKKQIMNDYMV